MSFDFGIHWSPKEIDGPHNDVGSEIAKFLDENKSKSTVYNTTSAVKRLNGFIKSESKNTYSKSSFELMEEKELDTLMCDFFMHAKKITKKTQTTELYQPDTLNNLRNGWQRFLLEKGISYDLKSGIEFKNSRNVLKARRKQLTRMGLGNKPNATRPLENVEIDKLFENGFFGSSNSLSLQRTIWWKITNHFGLRARDEARKLQFGDLSLKDDINGRQYLEWDRERGTKTRTGENSSSHQRAFNPKAYETGGDRCVVNLYKEFLRRRPAASKQSDSPFFLAMIPKANIKCDLWYFNRPLGANSIGKFMSDAKMFLNDKNETSRCKISNHSARKTSISTLLNENVHPLHVSQLSGHKNLESLRSYHTASTFQQENMSDLISKNDGCLTSFNNNNNGCSTLTTSSINQNEKPTKNDHNAKSLFQGASFVNCSINVNISSNDNKRAIEEESVSVSVKRRRVIFESDEE